MPYLLENGEFPSQAVVISISQVPKGFLVAQSVNNQPVMQETACNAGDPDSIPGLGRSPGEGNFPVFLPGKSHGRKEFDMTE